MKPQLVRPKPLATQAPQPIIQNQKAKLASPTNNYTEFLQTGSLEIKTAVAKREISHKKSQKPQNSTVSVLEETNQLTEGLNKPQSVNLAVQNDKGPLYNFYQCTEVLHQLSTTSRGNIQSSKNRSVILRGSSGDYNSQPAVACIQQQYSSLLKQRSNNAIHPQQTSSLIEHAKAAKVIKQNSTSFIQRANSHEMVPRLTPKQNNYVIIQQPPQVIKQHAHQSSHGLTPQGYWTQLEPTMDISRKNANPEGSQAIQSGNQNPSVLNKSFQTYHRQSKGLNNQTASAAETPSGIKYGTKSFRQSSLQQQKAKSCSKQQSQSQQQPIQKVLGAKKMIEKLQLQLKGLSHQGSGSNKIPAGRKPIQSDRARYQSTNIDVVGKKPGVFTTIPQPENEQNSSYI